MSKIRIIKGRLPEPFCHENWQKTYEAFMDASLVEFPESLADLIVQQQVPDPEDRDKLWARLDSEGYFERIYRWNNSLSKWIAPHPVPPGSPMAALYFAAADTIPAYDGGNASPLGLASGPMWEIVPAMVGRFPLGVGTLPSSAVVAVGAVGGEEKVTLGPDNLVHKHPYGRQEAGVDIIYLRKEPGLVPIEASGGEFVDQFYDTGSAPPGATMTTANMVTNKQIAAGDSTPHNNMPPWAGCNFIRRTNRKFYAVA